MSRRSLDNGRHKGNEGLADIQIAKPAGAVFSLNERSTSVCEIVPSGPWTTSHIYGVDGPLRQIVSKRYRTVQINMSDIGELDTAGAWLLERTIRELKKSGANVSIMGERDGFKTLLAAVSAVPEIAPVQTSGLYSGAISGIFEAAGRLASTLKNDFLMSMHMLGATIRGAQMKIGRSHGVSPAAIIYQMDKMGVGALPVIILMSFIIGAIIAQQGAFQLRYFGAEIFVVDLVGILVLREIGVLLTAIMVAGRSGSAITAEIGSMKMREEVDALKVIGLNPIGVLVFPRLVALVLVLPMLTVVSDISALFGASVVTSTYSGISPAAFIGRLRDAIDLSTYFAGLIKAPFME